MIDANADSDDRSINDDTVLWRRLPQNGVATDSSAPNGRRPSSANFADAELSVVIAAECIGGTDRLLKNHAGFGVFAFRVADARSVGWGVVRAPDDNLPGHAHVTGRKTHGQRSKVAKLSQIVVEPRN